MWDGRWQLIRVPNLPLFPSVDGLHFTVLLYLRYLVDKFLG